MERTAAHLIVRDHQQRPLLRLIGISRCRDGCGTWPCNLWLYARDQRSRGNDITVIMRITDIVGRRTPAPPPNRGRYAR